MNRAGLILVLYLIPNPAEKEDFYQPLAEGVLDRYLAGILNGVAVGIGYSTCYRCTALLCGIDLAVIVNRCNFCIR